MTTPENWVVVKFVHSGQTTYKVFAEWRGNFTTGDSWRMNSGIKSVTFDGECYDFEGFSGSVYHCYRDSYGIRGVFANGILNDMLERVRGIASVAEIMDEDTDFTAIEY